MESRTRPIPSVSEPFRGYVDEETGEYLPPPKQVGPRASMPGTDRAELARFVAETRVKAESDGRRFADIAAQSGLVAVVALGLSWFLGSIFWSVFVLFGARALWFIGKCLVEAHLMGVEPESMPEDRSSDR